MNTDAGPEWVPQFQEIGVEAWGRLILSDDAEYRIRSYRWAPDMLLGEILRYAMRNDAAMIADLKLLYGKCVQHGMPIEDRRALYRHVAGFQQAGRTFSANAYLCFIACETDRSIASTAVIDYVSLAPIDGSDEMSRVRDIIGMIAGDFPANVGAAFGALLYAGDHRVTRLLLPLRDMLSAYEANEAILCRTGFLNAASVEFLLDWLEGMDGSARDRLFGIVASGLALCRRDLSVPMVALGERTFPVTALAPAQSNERLKLAKIEDYTAQIAHRLRRLERHEPEPKVMPTVLEIWSIEPHRHTRAA